VAIYALTQKNDSSGTGSSAATSQHLTQLDDRVDRLSRQVQQARADARAGRALVARVDALSRSVTALRSQAGSSTAAPDTTQAIQDLGKRLATLEQRVQDLSAQTTTTP
jgi:polyhydroxyalkanoate synthesis regulator phasin